ncbi:MAG: hypothetical protein ACOYK9_04470 [Chlamydiia bacterium]
MRWNKQALKRWILWSNPKDSPQKIALIRTLQVHMYLLLLLSIGSFAKKGVAPKQHIRLKTVHVEEKKIPIAKGEPKKPAVKKKEKGAPMAAAIQKKTPKKSTQLERLNTLDESLKKLEKSFKNPPKELVVEAKATQETLHVVQYETQVIQALQLALKLIDPDSVDVTITVQPNGIVDTIADITSASALNIKIVECALAKMVFPPFEGDQPMELTLHLCTE